MNDPEELQKTTASLAILTSRMAEFNELVSIAALVSEGNEELASSLENLQKVKSLAENARTNGVEALDALNSIADGKKPATDYEQATQNLALTYMLVDRQICIGKQYVCDVDAFLRDKNVEDYKELALARDLWAGYCAGEAVLNGDSEELEYWNKQESLISSDALALKAADFTMAKYPVESQEVLRQCMTIDEAAGLAYGDQVLKANGALNESVAEGAVPQALRSFADAQEALFQAEAFRTQQELGLSEVQQFIAPEVFDQVLGAVSGCNPGLSVGTMFIFGQLNVLGYGIGNSDNGSMGAPKEMDVKNDFAK